MKRKRPPLELLVPLMLWDTAWKGAAIIAAIRNRQWRWIGPLAAVNSAGLLPMIYLWKFRARRAAA